MNGNELERELRPLLEELITETLGSMEDDLQAYGEKITRDFADYLYRTHSANDEVARENLRDLRAQVEILTGIHAVRASHVLRDKLVAAVVIAAQIALRALRVTLPT